MTKHKYKYHQHCVLGEHVTVFITKLKHSWNPCIHIVNEPGIIVCEWKKDMIIE